MATTRSYPAGRVRLDGGTMATWEANGSGWSGDWSDITHWSTSAVPGIDTPVEIADFGNGSPGWLVTETAESAASLLLSMTNGGTLAASSGLTVAGTLTQTEGELLIDPGAVVAAAALLQQGGSIVVNDDGSGTTFLESAGTDSVQGAVTLVNAANWSDAALTIGLGRGGFDGTINASVTLAGGSGPATLAVAGALQLGADPITTSAGIGTLAVENGSVVTAASLVVVDDSVVTLDAESGIAVGSNPTAAAGAITVASDGAVTADIALLGGDMINAGTFAIVSWTDGAVSVPGDVLITGSLVNAGGISLAVFATLAVGGSIELDAGSLSVAAGGRLTAGESDAAGTGLYLAGGALTLDGGKLESLGTEDFANSNATLTSGAAWDTPTLSIAPGFTDGTTADATVTLSGTSTLADASSLNIGQDPGIGAAVSTDPGGLGVLALSGGSVVTATDLAVVNGSTLSLDATSAVALGSAALEAGSVGIGAGRLLFSDIATIAGNLDDAGSLDVAQWQGGSLVKPGSVLVTGSLTGSGAIAVTGTLTVGDGRAFAGSIALADGSELILDAGGMAGAPVTATGTIASIDVLGQSLDTTAFAPTYDSATGLLVFGDAASQTTVDVGAGLMAANFRLAPDGDGTLITEAPCYAAGTSILGEHGEVPVQALRPGDLLRTRDGRLVPVRWVGWRRIELSKHQRPCRVAPVRILAGAIAPGVPSRDLLVSPDHALFVAGALVPAARLANGATIARDDGFSAVTYFHIELDRHEIILAENCPAETYLDTGNRALFANAEGPSKLHPEFADAPDPAALAVWAGRGAAPLLLDGPALDALRATLAARAEKLGWIVAVPRPALLADGMAVPLRAAGEGVWRARLHPAARRLHLCCDSFVPAESFPANGDTRRLGLAVRDLRLDGARLTPEAFGSGWHAPEDGFRWSDGHGEILLPPRARPATLEVLAVPPEPCWRAPRRPAAAALRIAGCLPGSGVRGPARAC